MMNRNSKNQYYLRTWRLIMDARVKPGNDDLNRMRCLSAVMPGFMAGIHDFHAQDVDGWVKPGHDVERRCYTLRVIRGSSPAMTI
jgi:hypothetical protein